MTHIIFTPTCKAQWIEEISSKQQMLGGKTNVTFQATKAAATEFLCCFPAHHDDLQLTFAALCCWELKAYSAEVM